MAPALEVQANETTHETATFDLLRRAIQAAAPSSLIKRLVLQCLVLRGVTQTGPGSFRVDGVSLASLGTAVREMCDAAGSEAWESYETFGSKLSKVLDSMQDLTSRQRVPAKSGKNSTEVVLLRADVLAARLAPQQQQQQVPPPSLPQLAAQPPPQQQVPPLPLPQLAAQPQQQGAAAGAGAAAGSTARAAPLAAEKQQDPGPASLAFEFLPAALPFKLSHATPGAVRYALSRLLQQRLPAGSANSTSTNSGIGIGGDGSGGDSQGLGGPISLPHAALESVLRASSLENASLPASASGSAAAGPAALQGPRRQAGSAAGSATGSSPSSGCSEMRLGSASLAEAQRFLDAQVARMGPARQADYKRHYRSSLAAMLTQHAECTKLVYLSPAPPSSSKAQQERHVLLRADLLLGAACVLRSKPPGELPAAAAKASEPGHSPNTPPAASEAAGPAGKPKSAAGASRQGSRASKGSGAAQQEKDGTGGRAPSPQQLAQQAQRAQQGQHLLEALHRGGLPAGRQRRAQHTGTTASAATTAPPSPTAAIAAVLGGGDGSNAQLPAAPAAVAAAPAAAAGPVALLQQMQEACRDKEAVACGIDRVLAGAFMAVHCSRAPREQADQAAVLSVLLGARTWKGARAFMESAVRVAGAGPLSAEQA